MVNTLLTMYETMYNKNNFNLFSALNINTMNLMIAKKEIHVHDKNNVKI